MEDERSLSAEGAVVEILERGGERIARIVLDPGTVIELPAPPFDIHLGDRVLVDASLRIERVQGRPELTPHVTGAGASAGRRSGATAPSPGRLAFRDYEHVLRMAGLFVLAIAAFLVWRSWMVPRDFGVYGHFRAGAIADAASGPLRFAGQASCVGCHDEVQTVRATGRHAAIACEACHGPLGQHARGETDVAPVRPSPRALCLTCHTALQGRPKALPQIVVKDHSEAGPCTECHKAHAPGIS